MADAPSPVLELQPPALLIAMPQVLDPFFHKSVVLLAHQDEEDGSLGFIVNRATEMPVAEILEGLELSWSGTEDAVAYFGGPVHPQLGSVLFPLADGRPPEGVTAASELAPGVGITQHVADLGVLAADPPGDLRLVLGYAGWAAGQLVEEILRDDWLIAPVGDDFARSFLFATDPENVWERALASVGVAPGSLPSWTSGSGGEGAN